MSKRWTDTDDSIVLLFPAAEAAELLGRTIAAVHMRRHRKGYSSEHRDRQPQKRLRREYFQRDGQGPREEIVPPSPKPLTCRYCSRAPVVHGLCRKCHVQRPPRVNDVIADIHALIRRCEAARRSFVFALEEHEQARKQLREIIEERREIIDSIRRMLFRDAARAERLVVMVRARTRQRVLSSGKSAG